MSIRDTAWTNPDSLRTLYTSPRNPLRDLDDVSTTAQTLVAVTPSLPPSGLPGGGGGGYGGGGGGGGCPAVGQFTLARMGGTHATRPVLVEAVTRRDHLWNPITNTFRPVIAAEIMDDVECVIYRTFAGAVSVVSLTQPIIQEFTDTCGTQMVDLLQNLDLTHKAVSCIDFKPIASEIDWIKSAGRRSVVRISLEKWNEPGDGIYVFGTDPLRTNVGHNKPPINDPRDPNGGGG